MRIALLQPPVEDFYQTSIRTQPVGLLYLAAALEQRGHSVAVFDFLACGGKEAVPFPPIFSYLKPHFPPADSSPIRVFKHFYHFGSSWSEIEASLAAQEFDLYGIACMFTPFQGQADRLASVIRKLHPERPIVAGGTHATSCPERLLATGLFDAVFAGEGELSLAQSLESVRVGDRSVIPPCALPDLDALPLPARHLVDVDHYRIDGVRSTMLITSRGCPYRCTFCSVQQTMGHAFRTRSVENVIGEIRQCLERLDIHHFDIEDDNFTFDQKRADALMTAVLDSFGEGTLRFSAMNGLTATDLNPSLLRRMRQAGFREINLSLVASQGATLKRLKRPVSFAGFCSTVQSVRSAEMNCTAYFILGLPGDDASRMLHTLLALAEQPVLVGPSVFYLSPGTELFKELADKVPECWDLMRSSSFYTESGDSSRLERITLFRLTRLVNFLKDRLDRGSWQEEKRRAYYYAELHNSEDPDGPGSTDPPQGRLYRVKPEGNQAAVDLGWVMVHLLQQTLFFYSAERTAESGRSYTFKPLPTSEAMVSEFLRLSRSVVLKGGRSPAGAPLWEMLAPVSPGARSRGDAQWSPALGVPRPESKIARK